MKAINLLMTLIIIACNLPGKAQTLTAGIITKYPGDNFSYDGKQMPHYGLQWCGDSKLGGESSWLSGYMGIKFFTFGKPRMHIDLNGTVCIGENPQKLDNQLVINSIGRDIPNDGIAILREDNSPNLDIYSNYNGNTDIQQGSFAYGVRPCDNAWQIYNRDGLDKQWVNLLHVSISGDVGIGTSSPSEKLSVNGNFLLGDLISKTGGLISFGNENHGIRRNENIIDIFTAGGYGSGFSFSQKEWSSATQSYSVFKESMRITYTGNVGIGVSDPTEKLSVDGNIRSRKVIVTQTGWPDYVFEPSYQLPSLDSVHNFIKANKHLPGMAPAAVVEKEGLDLGEVVKQQQQKIEELMLYIIELKKEVNELKSNQGRKSND